ncbi:hypothetical protein BTO15_00175 [Polaribacter sejongensis]|uniref:Uncharacterized protein n=1 Tax=Polaribacter sejongensis TaxID=985043 RepID=A0ABN5F8G8_9FLAO|nr:hypothetical protein [Polaribacter sejongensis]AUC20625.1 hypothetical protein BTO15_00175 [Polaribacter sejongensis]
MNNKDNSESSIINPENSETVRGLSKKQIEKQDEILELLKDVTLKQSKTAKKQSKFSKIQFFANLFLAITTLIIGIFALKPEFSDQNNTEYKTLSGQILKSEKTILKQAILISELSNNLLYLQNRVQTLEKQNELLSTKKPLKK